MPIEIAFFVVLIVGIISSTILKLAHMIFVEYPRHRMAASREAPERSIALEKRVAELENRVLTLQDIVMGGSYSARALMEVPPVQASLSASEAMNVERTIQPR